MIKYAKTKDGKIVKIHIEGGVFTSRYEIVGELKNTIEELCDVVIETKGATGDYKHYIYEGERYKKLKPKIIDDIRTQNFNVYAAIWSEWGLKYVAKMNDKGELELI